MESRETVEMRVFPVLQSQHIHAFLLLVSAVLHLCATLPDKDNFTELPKLGRELTVLHLRNGFF